MEFEVSRKFIFEEKIDVIINIVDSTFLERSIYLWGYTGTNNKAGGGVLAT